MFGELQKLFDRNFAVGYFLPSLVFTTAFGYLLNRYVLHVDLLGLQEFYVVAVTTALGLLTLLGGIVLVAMNRDLYRFFEGYESYNPLAWFKGFESRRFHKVRDEYDNLEKEYKACEAAKKPFPSELEQKQGALRIILADEFPEEEEYLLPTAFGNALRAFESFPRVMYGLDSIPAWGRVLAVTPKEYIELLDGAKANVDMWVNFGGVFIALPVMYVAFALQYGDAPIWWLVALAAPIEAFAAWRATSAAREWGHYVKAAFDVYSPRLREALGIEEPANREEERAQWEAYSRALIYRLPEHLPPLKPKTKAASPPEPDPSPRGARVRSKS